MTTVYYMPYEIAEGEHRYKKEHLLALQLLRRALEKEMHIFLSPEEMRERYAYGEYGKPYLAGYEDLCFSISHCDGWVACAVSERPVGIDVERVGAVPESALYRILTEEERARTEDCIGACGRQAAERFCRLWTLKESYLKWCGRGFFMDPRKVGFTFSQEKGSDRILCSDPAVRFGQICPDGDCVLSVCCEGGEIVYESYKEKVAGTGGELPG